MGAPLRAFVLTLLVAAVFVGVVFSTTTKEPAESVSPDASSDGTTTPENMTNAVSNASVATEGANASASSSATG